MLNLELDLDRKNSFIFDFDSTLVSIEALDTLVKSRLKDAESDAVRRIDDITRRSMNGDLSFDESLRLRFESVKMRVEHFKQMGREICASLTDGMEELLKDLIARGQELFIVSGGFYDIINPVATRLGVPPENVFVNELITGPDGRVIGVKESPLAHEGGKAEVVRILKEQGRLPGKIIMLGDGMSDCGVFSNGLSDFFIGCGFHVARPKVMACCETCKEAVFLNTVGELRQLLF
ncbi:phosphoserine phosphatase [Synergistales bacterium]|nr:phosphoserine phosphatase [Synergistales bacterium]